MTITNEFLNYEGLVVYDNEIRNYIDEKTAYTESDPTVPDYVKNITTGDISNWNSKSNFSGDYDDLTNKPTLGTLAGKSQVEKMDLSADLQTAVDRVDFAAGGTMGGSLTINGDLTVNGTSTTVETYNENVNVEDNTITLRYNATTGLQNSDYTGIVAQNYDGANNGMLVFDNSGTAYVGDSGDLQPLATRAFTDSDDGALAAWDASAKTLIKAPVEVEDIVTKENVDSFNKALSTATGDNDIAYQKDVTVEKASYAEVTKLGGMTYKSKNLWSHGDIVSTVYTYYVGWFLERITPNEQYTLTWKYSSNGTADTQNAIIIYTEAGAVTITSGIPFTITEAQMSTVQGAYAYFGSDMTSGSMTEIMLNEGEPKPYEPYFEGLRSAKVTEVKSVGVNLWDEQFEVGGYADNTGSGTSQTDRIRSANYIEVSPSTKYYFKISKSYARIFFADANKTFLSAVSLLSESFTTPENCRYITFYWINPTYTPGDIMLNKGTTAQPYTPYVEHTLSIPTAVQALDGYGLGVSDTIYNYIDWEKKQFVKRVAVKVFNGTERLYDYIAPHNEITADSPLVHVPWSLLASHDGIGSANKYSFSFNATRFNVKSTDEMAAYLAQQFANGTPVTVIYELAEPIVTDISDLIGDNSIGVQSNGTLTFENEYQLAAPSDVVFYNEKADIVAADKLVGNLIGVSTRAISDEDGNSIANTYMKKSNALEVISGLTEMQLQKLISLIDTIEIQ